MANMSPKKSPMPTQEPEVRARNFDEVATGYSEAAANAVYGSYSTLAISMFNLPAAFVTPIALALVPVLTSAINGRDRYKEINTLNSSLRLTGLITLPASLGLSVFSRPILEFVFNGEDSAINTAAPLLSVLGLSVFFSCMMTVTNAVLQAYGKERLPLVSMLVGSAVKIVLSYVLLGIPQINVFGASISTFACCLSDTSKSDLESISISLAILPSLESRTTSRSEGLKPS